MNIIIAGAGIGGLTAAIVLARNGHHVQVLEQAPEPKPVGAGISLQPNAMQALATLELDQAIADRGCAASIAHLRFSDGRPVRSMDFSPSVERYGYLPHTILRSDLHDLLQGAATEAGAEVRFGSPLVSFQIESQTVLVKTPKNELHAEALIGADGIRSKVRSGLFGEDPIRYAGYVCWRGIVTDPKLVLSIETMNECWGRGTRCGFMRCSQDKVYWFATKTQVDRLRPDESWKAEFANWPEPVAALLESTPESQISFNEISDRKPIFPWSSGPVTLLGDAAHPMTPNFGQGGAQAIEDAIVLARAIDAADDPATAFELYQQHRHARTKTFVDGSLRFGRVAQGGNPFWRMIRNHIVPRLPESLTRKMLDEQFMVQSHLRAQLG